MNENRESERSPCTALAEARACAFTGVDRWPLDEVCNLAVGGTVVAVGVDHRDRLLVTTSAADPDDTWASQLQTPGGTFPSSQTSSVYPLCVTATSADGSWSETTTLSVPVAFPKVQPLPDSRWLVVGARSRFHPSPEGPEHNAHVYGPSGEHETSFCVGDGVRGVQTTPTGKIWVSYFDEGVFGNYGWGGTGESAPYGSPGLVKWTTSGARVEEFDPPGGFDRIVDCYAMNATGEGVWACYYTDFPVVHVKPDGGVAGWATHANGPTSLAVKEGSCVGLIGGYNGLFDRLEVVNITNDGPDRRDPCGNRIAPTVATYQLATPDLDEFPADAHILARGRFVHVVADGHWYRLDIDHLPPVNS